MNVAAKKTAVFEYDQAFTRNLGITTIEEQRLLRTKRVAIPGCGGVGSAHALVLARLGVGKFVVSDFDVYELPNFNRQFGARVSTLGQEKVGVVADEIRDINPEAEIRRFAEGISAANVRDFLAGVDVVVDSLDFFAQDARLLLFKTAREMGIPVVTAAPLSLSCALLIFTPDGMSYEDYFGFSADDTPELRAAKFGLGLAPKLLQMPYTDSRYTNLKAGTGPSSVIGVTLCASLAATEVFRLLCGRGKVLAAPYYRQFDAYRNIFRIGRMPGGAANPWYRFKLWYAKRFILPRLRGQQ